MNLLTPEWSHSRNVLYEPMANKSPTGDHAIDVIWLSCSPLENICLPWPSHTRYLQSSPPDTIKSEATLQAKHNTMPSWAFHYSS